MVRMAIRNLEHRSLLAPPHRLIVCLFCVGEDAPSMAMLMQPLECRNLVLESLNAEVSKIVNKAKVD